MSRRSHTTLLAAAACALLAVLVWVVTYRTGAGRAADLSAFRGFRELSGTWVASLAARYAHLCDPGPFALLSAAVTATAMLTRGPRAALVVAAVLVVPNLVTQELKPALAEPRVGVTGVDAASWPSGHSTAAMALALCAVIAAPAAWRWVVAAAGALFAVAIGYAVVLLGWHFPSDVLGGFAVAGAGAAAGAALLRPAPASRGLPVALPLAGVFVAGGALLLLDTALRLQSPAGQAAFVVVGAAIGVLALLLSAAAAGAFSPRAATTALRSRSRRATG